MMVTIAQILSDERRWHAKESLRFAATQSARARYHNHMAKYLGLLQAGQNGATELELANVARTEDDARAMALIAKGEPVTA